MIEWNDGCELNEEKRSLYADVISRKYKSLHIFLAIGKAMLVVIGISGVSELLRTSDLSILPGLIIGFPLLLGLWHFFDKLVMNRAKYIRNGSFKWRTGVVTDKGKQLKNRKTVAYFIFVDGERCEAASYQTYRQAKVGDSAMVIRVTNITIAFME